MNVVLKVEIQHMWEGKLKLKKLTATEAEHIKYT